ncbi:hypothetical protein [Actinomadura bangladeshensis]|uniref:Uncharacterized protein n=1 Tax=Actinomadura bangladeshensis TaxID=453573 RepID=A0A4R4P797_9ACTN|nr:hypothetical protein [Actinomadura bangladeshensis]TDC18378.1 hypothetical protein E1284_06540 [Actinomadura bangladeshensis]
MPTIAQGAAAAGPWVLGLATIAVLTIPLATESGEHLEDQVARSSLVEEHAELGAPFIGYGVAPVTEAGPLAVCQKAAGRET